jgi:Holliday junction DNA helicase RuvB
MREDYLRGDSEELNPVEREIEKVLRPLTFEDFTGQQKIIDNIKVFVQAAKQREEHLDHVLLHGPPGLGKTTLSHIIANELGANIKVTSGPVGDATGRSTHTLGIGSASGGAPSTRTPAWVRAGTGVRGWNRPTVCSN